MIEARSDAVKRNLECIETWNVRSMNQGELEVVKQEMARVNVDILGISELKWPGMCEFNSDDHHIYCCGILFSIADSRKQAKPYCLENTKLRPR